MWHSLKPATDEDLIEFTGRSESHSKLLRREFLNRPKDLPIFRGTLTLIHWECSGELRDMGFEERSKIKEQQFNAVFGVR